MKGNHARQVTFIHALRREKIHTREMLRQKKIMRLKNPPPAPPPITFLIVCP